jgi:DNA-binding transcriptional LysR family regulator
MKTAHLSKLDLNLLKVFAAVHRERHMTRAGRSLYVGQSAISHAIARLREVFGDPLFIRTPKGMQPTPLADRLAEPIQRALQTVSDAIRTEEAFDPANACLQFRVGTTMLQAFHFLPQLYRRIEKDAPNVDLLIRAPTSNWPDVLNALDENVSDVLLVIPPSDQGDAPLSRRFICENLFEDQLVCVVSKDNPLVGKTLDIETYARLPHLVMASDHVGRTWIDEALQERGLQRRIAVTAPHPFAIPLLTSGTQLVSTVARSLILPFVDRSNLRLLEPPIGAQRHVFQMIWPARTDRDPAMIWFRNIVRESCRLATPLQTEPGLVAEKRKASRSAEATGRRRRPANVRPSR